ncbi:putative RNA-directed DNA polymerase, eukaryota, reverse transcriptase zinc-binding domain protein [Tanacetum coccineum]
MSMRSDHAWATRWGKKKLMLDASSEMKSSTNKYSIFKHQRKSKSDNDPTTLFKVFWGNRLCDYAIKKPDGLSGAIISIWDDSMFSKHNVVVVDGVLAIYAEWTKHGINWVVEAIVSASTHPSIILKRKLQDLKTSIRAWRTEKDLNKDNLIRELKNKVTYLELKAESCDLDDNEIACRLSSLKDIEDLEYLKSQELMGYSLMDRGPETLHSNLFKTLTDSDALFLDGPISSIEIKDAVWSCGSSKARGPDGFIFKFIKHHWDTVGHNFIDMVRRFEIDGFIPKAWASKKRERLFDFEKAFDSFDWKFLDHTMEQMGFSHKWRKWIHGCLNSSYWSVLINGSPTKEFKIQKGLRQGDPLSPFLFIIAMEALHVSIQDAKSKGIFEGVNVGSNGINISHLQLANDALIMGTWSIDNVKNLCRILRCFHMASGLKVNFSKSKFFGICVNESETNTLASILNLQPSYLPCSYLGLPIGANLNKCNSWKPIIDKFQKWLTSWNARALSFGGRLTILKSVLGALGTYFFSLFKAPTSVINQLEKLRRNFFWGGSLDRNKLAWIAWKKVCSSTNRGGLGIGSLYASNLAMLAKWWWRFHSETILK